MVESLFKNKKFQVDFSALHQCMHIYTTMGIHGQFETYYRDNRRHQANAVLKPKERISAANMKSYFYKVAGFFILEVTVLQTANKLMPRAMVRSTMVHY
jgi:hypothetical protein